MTFAAQTLAARTDVAAMIAPTTAKLHAATMGAVVKIAMITVAEAKNSEWIIFQSPCSRIN